MAQRRIAKQSKRTKYLVGGLAIFIMVSSIIGFVVSDLFSTGGSLGGNVQYYGSYKFSPLSRPERQSWEVKINGQKYEVFYLPAQLADLPYDNGTAKALQGVPYAYSTIGPQDANRTITQETLAALAHYQLQRDFSSMGTEVIPAISRIPSDPAAKARLLPGIDRLPVIGCANATDLLPVIDFRESLNASLSLEGNCIVIQANRQEEFYRIYDRLLLGVLGVMP